MSGYQLKIDLEAQTVTRPDGKVLTTLKSMRFASTACSTAWMTSV
jgi:hypothetical protein